ncbi:MAG TPA: glycosyltransferase [Solirubrobacteraceae bacterium]
MSTKLAVAICTRSRPQQLARTLDALSRQQGSFPVLVVDQSPQRDTALAHRTQQWSELTVIADSGRGLSRARNIAWRALDAEWIAFIDDDCLVESDWATALAAEIERHPEVSLISGEVAGHRIPQEDYAAVTTRHVPEPLLISGQRRPWLIGFGVCVVRRSTIEQLGGWDERLGAGAARYPGAEDMDFNYRLLRAGHSAYVTPEVRVLHDQWRRRSELPAVYESYMTGWAGFSMKHLRSGDVSGGLRLWSYGALDFARMFASSIRRRSAWRARLAAHKLRGLLVGTARGLRERW